MYSLGDATFAKALDVGFSRQAAGLSKALDVGFSRQAALAKALDVGLSGQAASVAKAFDVGLSRFQTLAAELEAISAHDTFVDDFSIGRKPAIQALVEATVARLSPEERLLVCVWAVASVALHGSNVASTMGGRFDLYQLVDDQVKAIALALAVVAYVVVRRGR